MPADPAEITANLDRLRGIIDKASADVQSYAPPGVGSGNLSAHPEVSFWRADNGNYTVALHTDDDNEATERDPGAAITFSADLEMLSGGIGERGFRKGAKLRNFAHFVTTTALDLLDGAE